MNHKLSRQVKFEDTTYTELNVDFEKLVGDDLKTAERAYAREQAEFGGPPTMVKEINKGYLAHIVAIAASVPVELINKLPAKDFSSLTLDAQAFLTQ